MTTTPVEFTKAAPLEKVAEADTWGYLKAIAEREIIPIGFHVDLTYECDLACSHCYLESRKRRELTVQEYREFFAELAHLGGFFLLISGGDIFVRPDALEILWAAAEHRFDMALITHAMAIDDYRADQLAEMGVRKVNVSLYHSDPAIHDAVTKRRGSFERTVAGMRRLVERGVHVNAKCPVFGVNQGAERVMPAFCASMGFDCELSAQIRGANDGTDDLLSLNLDLEDTARVYSCINSQHAGLEKLEAWSPDDRTCLAAHGSAYLGPDGTIQPCLEYEQVAGNIRDQSFTEIWRTSPLLQHLRGLRRKDFAGCQDCGNYSFCGLCPAVAARETGDPTGSAPSKCRESTAVRLAFEQREAEQMASELDLMGMFGLG